MLWFSTITLLVGVLVDLSVAFSSPPTWTVVTPPQTSILCSLVSVSSSSSPPSPSRVTAGSLATRTSTKRPRIRVNHVLSTQEHPSSCSRLSMIRNDDDVIGSERILSCLPYLVPILDGDRYGRFIYNRFPLLGAADTILLGRLKSVWSSLPYVNLIAFFLLLVLVRNTYIPRSIRFNMQQALLLDVTLILPSLSSLMSWLVVPEYIKEPATNFFFYYLVTSVGYSLFSNLSGKKPNQIPLISEAAEMQVGPF